MEQPGPPARTPNLGIAAGALGALAVVAGAFGAHALRGRLDAASLATFETAARYHLIHALAAAFAADRAARPGGEAPGRAAGRAALLFVVGIALFSGSLYGLALGGPRLLGAITPLGGLSLIAGWLVLAASFRGR